jgi:TPR repeat protein
MAWAVSLVSLVACGSEQPKPRHPSSDGSDADSDSAHEGAVASGPKQRARPKKPLTCEERLKPALQQAKDPKAELEVYEGACDTGCVAACDRGATRFLLSFATDSAKDARYFWRDCELGSGVACAALGDRYKAGHGVEVDPNHALELYERACNQGTSLGCSGQARMLQWASTEADHVKELDAKAARLNEQRCKEGDQFYCTLLADATKDGAGVPKDIRRAIQLYDVACRSGLSRACDSAKTLGP